MSQPHGSAPDEPGAHAPDDARDLALEAQALSRERAAARRRARWERLLGGPGLSRRGFAALVAASVLVLSVVGLLAAVLGPDPLPPPGGSARLADVPASGREEGHLLPDATLPALTPGAGDDPAPGGRTVPLRPLRPAVVALVPPGCGCPGPLAAAADTAAAFAVRFVVVAGSGGAGGAPDAAELRALLRDADLAAAEVLLDVDGLLDAGEASGASGLTALVVAPDGVVTGVEPDLATGARLVPALQRALARR